MPDHVAEGALETPVVAERVQPLDELCAQLVVDLDPLRARGLAEEQRVEFVQPGQLGDGLLVVIHPQVDEHVAQPGVASVTLDHEQRGRLLAAAVSSRRLRGRDALEQSFGQWAACRCLERRGQDRHGLCSDQDVALGRKARAGEAAGPVHAFTAREGRAAAGRVDDTKLTVFTLGIGSCETLDHLLGTRPAAQQCEPVRAVTRVRIRLGRDRAHSGLRPGDDRSDREELGLGRDAPLPCLEVARRDRVGRDDGGVPSHRSAR